MPHTPRFGYFLYHSDAPVRPGDHIWNTPLPMNRKNEREAGFPFPTHGDHFSAARSFLEKEGSERVAAALSSFTGQSISPEDIREIHIVLEKHGQFYHPARMEFLTDTPPAPLEGGFSKVSSIPPSRGARGVFPFVLNAAISHAGRNCIQREYALLERLGSDLPAPFLPRVFAHGKGVTEKGMEIPMFMGQWFGGYHEFHISRNERGETGICVWDTEKGNFFLPRDNTREIYRQVARILTFYYNMETGEQIYPWHHAAGDFVVRPDDNGGIDLRLITVREYTPLMERKADDALSLLENLLFFLLNLSIRTRLDRLDGIRDIAWADETAVDGTLDGFFDALASKPCPDFLPGPADMCFRAYVSSCTQDNLTALCRSLLNAFYDPAAPEMAVAEKNIEAHAAALQERLKV